MDFCHPGWVSRTVSHNQSTQQHYQILHPSETGKERAGTRYHSLSHQGGIHLVLLTHPGDVQNPAQEENQNSLSLQASPGKNRFQSCPCHTAKASTNTHCLQPRLVIHLAGIGSACPV